MQTLSRHTTAGCSTAWRSGIRSACILLLAMSPQQLNAQLEPISPDTILLWGARVRYVLPDETERGTAVVGQIGECLVILHRVEAQTWARVRLDRIVSLEVSTLYDGSSRPNGTARTYTEANDTVGESWRALDLPVIRRRYGQCGLPASATRGLHVAVEPSTFGAARSHPNVNRARAGLTVSSLPTASATSRSSGRGSSAGIRTATPSHRRHLH